MTERRRHRIHRAVFELRFPDEATEFAVRHELETMFHASIAPALEQALDAFSPDGVVHRIDRLEIDLGRLAADRLDRAGVAEAVRASLGAQLRRLAADEVEVVSVPASLSESLIAFLSTGRLPWHSTVRGTAELERALLSLPAEEGERLAARIRPMLARTAAARRFAYQFEHDLVRSLVGWLHPASAESLLRLAERELGGLDATEARRILISALARPPDVADADSLVRALRERVAPPDLDRARPDVSSWTREPGEGPETGLQGRGDPGEVGESEPAARADREPSVEAIPVTHAGIVLLHPFLERLLQRLGLVDARSRFGSRGDRLRAVHLLYHLATGDEHPEEPTTPLLKLLAGLPLDEPIPRRLRLEAAERLECETLLVEVIRLWDRLGETSPAGLREAFMAREGLLQSVDSGWRLTVEQRGVDVLIGSMPWGVSVIRLPWMEAPLFVDWA